MTITEKINKGLLKRETVRSVLAAIIKQYEVLKAEHDRLTGFNKDICANKLLALDADIKTGRFIWKRMNELGIV